MPRVLTLSNGHAVVILDPDSGDEIFVSDQVLDAINSGVFEELLKRVQAEFASAVDDCFEQDLPIAVKGRLEALRTILEKFNET